MKKSAKFRINSLEDYHRSYEKSVEDFEGFWADIASHFTWKQKWDSVFKGDFATGKTAWFQGAKLNITENCIDRHLAENADKTAIIWESNDPDESSKKITFRELHSKVCQMGNALKKLGIQKGDRVCIYMPMIPELTIAVLATARIGAIHSVVFAGFSAQSLAGRINDSECKMLITADGLFRGKKTIALKEICDRALKNTPSISTVLVAKRTGQKIDMISGRDLWLEDEIQKVDDHCPPEIMDAEDPLFILYTSGSTGKPKGITHSCGGYMVYATYSFVNVFQYDPQDIYWCTADIGWITGHSYIVYGPLLNGATTLMFEGVPTHPAPNRFWEICEKHRVNQLYTAPTAIRSLMALGDEHVKRHTLSSLKTIGSVGEPINQEAWDWYYTHVGKTRCAVVDTWWQTETGGIMISSLGKHSPYRPTYAGYPLPGIQPALLNQEGEEIQTADEEGYLVIKHPWPSMLRTIYGDHEKCQQVYYSNYKGYYFTGDSAKRDDTGKYRIIGRVDDVINVSGHRFGTAEIENAINLNPMIVESAVVGYPHDIKGQGIYVYAICLKNNDTDMSDSEIKKSIVQTVAKEIGNIAKPDKIQLVIGLPKTRSGKIMRRILRKIACKDTSNLGDVSTLLDGSVVEDIMKGSL